MVALSKSSYGGGKGSTHLQYKTCSAVLSEAMSGLFIFCFVVYSKGAATSSQTISKWIVGTTRRTYKLAATPCPFRPQ